MNIFVLITAVNSTKKNNGAHTVNINSHYYKLNNEIIRNSELP